ncbi:hypothetical protein [Bartonella rattaustraliani]|uniref:hypothetical protein n=1 Tax=Bartonella rattaustraliani TaxID=481139 RepID=UPI00036D6FC9|nr:hypothetical protein [Bartonella rattaustraliani]
MKSGCEGAAMEERGCGGGLALMRLGACVFIQGGKVLRLGEVPSGFWGRAEAERAFVP